MLDTAPEPLPHFTPERLPIETTTPERSVAEAAAHAAETAHEHGLRLPFFLDGEPVAAFVRERAHRLFERLGEPVTLPPEVLLLAFTPAGPGTDPGGALADHLRAARAHHA
ncbi:hypothetical protein FHX81_1425 [Saccharothrix saharensis]|uniref:Uncharacterized protein n=1 Tax=Saccharothrix saharensis TaxID=571190 RepID=A0A543J8G8_9PSEU|nr:hypothetical protein [Saccharothrix saharensis]TQM79130.1 hypothetical protein FHX81_1425 [Saccharothrix saharensis]